MKKSVLLTLILFMITLVGCQKKDSITLSSDKNQFMFSYVYPKHAVMISQVNDQYVLLAMKEIDQVMETYEVIQMPGIRGEVSIRSFYLVDDIPNVSLIIDGETKFFDTVSRMSLMGKYYALELETDGGEFQLNVTGPCFGKNNPCPFNDNVDAFISGPYVAYDILSYYIEHMDKPMKARLHQSSWYTIGEDTLAVYHLLTKYQNDLYKMVVQVIDGEVSYQLNKIDDGVITAKYISTNHHALMIYQDMSYQIIDVDLVPSEAGQFDGIFDQTIPYYGNQVTIETSTHYYIFMDAILKESIQKMSNAVYLGGRFDDELGLGFKYYYVIDNELKIGYIKL